MDRCVEVGGKCGTGVNTRERTFVRTCSMAGGKGSIILTREEGVCVRVWFVWFWLTSGGCNRMTIT